MPGRFGGTLSNFCYVMGFSCDLDTAYWYWLTHTYADSYWPACSSHVASQGTAATWTHTLRCLTVCAQLAHVHDVHPTYLIHGAPPGVRGTHQAL